MLSLSVVTLIGLAAAGMSPSTPPTAAAKTVPAEARLLDAEAWIMGGSGTPIPPPDYLEAVSERYINLPAPFFDGQPLFPVDAVNPLFTPEGLYPTSGIKGLTLDASLAQGVSILNSTIKDQVDDENSLVVVGGSQSSTIASLEMRDLLALPTADQPTVEQLSFVLLGDPSNPAGGLLERFGDPSLPPLSLPSLGLTFSGATPAGIPWDTAIYTAEYDGIADFPRYPLNLLADLNAVLGMAFVHTAYLGFDDAQMASVIELPVSDGDGGHTHYFMFPTDNLPLLEPVRALPVVGNPLADLLQPDLKVLVNLGYGDIEHGWDPGPADVPTPFGLFPDVDPGDVLTALADGAQQGVHDFIDDLGSLSLPTVPDLGAEVAGFAADPLSGFTEIVNAFTAAAASAYATLLPIADFVNAMVATLPVYDVNLFAQELTSGNPLDAIGLPIAADVGLASVAAGFLGETFLNTATSIGGDFQDLVP